MDVRVMRHCRAPGVQHRGDADAGAEMLGVGSDCHHRLGRRLEHDVVDRCLVLIGEVGDWPRQREHDVEVGNRQQLGLAFGHPLLCRRALALGAVPVATGIVGDDGIGAVLAARDVPAQHRRAAALDRCHDLELPKTSRGRHWLAAMPPRGRGRYPRPPAPAATCAPDVNEVFEFP